MVIIAFVFYTDVLLYSQQGDDITRQFQRAKTEYNSGQYVSSKNRLERVIGTIKAKKLEVERKDILGKCYLLLGAIYEKEGETILAEENYRRAIVDCEIEDLSVINIDDLTVLKDVAQKISNEKHFEKAKKDFLNGNYDDARYRLEWTIGIINKEPSGQEDILGKCYLLLGVIYEKEGKVLILAERNYRKAMNEYKIDSIPGVDLSDFSLYSRFLKAKRGMIESVGIKTEKKFPWLLVVGGVVALVTIAILFISKKEKRTLTVARGEGVVGSPDSGTFTYKKGAIANYSYSAQAGYKYLEVRLDDSVVPDSGTITMDRAHTLTATATANVVNFVTDKNEVEISEGGNAAFNIKLSAQPITDVIVTVSRESGDSDIDVDSRSRSIAFSSADWDSFKAVTITASDDEDTENGQATIKISAPGIQDKSINVTEKDDDLINFITDKNFVTIEEGRSNNFGVKLSRQPSSDVTAEVKRVSGDSDIFVFRGNTLTFKPLDWDIFQWVTIRARNDDDRKNSEAVIQISAPGAIDKNITAQESEVVLVIGIEWPKANSEVRGSVTISTEVRNLNRIDHVAFLIDDEKIGEDDSLPYEFVWDTTDNIIDGLHTIKVVVRDEAGLTDDEQITVFVANSPK